MGRSLHNKIFGSTSCLSEEQLLKYGSDSLTRKEKHKVEKHLVECELCSDALEGFALIPAGAGLNEVRLGVRHIASQGKSVPNNYWKWVLVAASMAGIAFISFFFLFQDNKMGDKMLAENKEVQPPAAEKPMGSAEITTEISEPDNVMPDGDDKSVEEEGGNFKLEGSGSALITKKDQEAISSLKEVEKVATAVKSGKVSKDMDEVAENEEKPLALADVIVSRQAESPSAITEKSFRPEKNYQALAEASQPIQKGISGNAGNDMEARKKKSKESAFSGEKKSLSKSTSSSSGQEDKVAETPKVKYIDNLKVVDYSEEYTSMAGPEVQHIPAKFENTEVARKAEAEEQFQTQTLMYDDVLKEGLAGLESKNYQLAMEKFNLILKNFPGDLNAIFYSGLVYYQQENFEKALANFNITTSSGNNAFHDEGNWYKALTYQKKNDREKARAMFRQISEQESFYKKRASDMLEEMDKK